MKHILSSVLLLAGALFVGSAVLSRRSAQGMHSNVQQTNEDSSVSPIPTSVVSGVQDGVMHITFNRPKVLNALDLNMVEVLQQLLMAARTDERVEAFGCLKI